MTSKQELKDRLAARTTEVVDLRREVNALNRELSELRNQPASQTDEPGPRTFRVGDRVRVAEGAKAKNAFGESVGTCAAGKEGLVRVIHADGDLLIDNEGYASPQFCTLIEGEPTAAPEPTPPAPSARVEVVYNDGMLGGFDGDMVEISDDGPIYEVYKGGAFVACVSIMQARSIAVVR